MTSSGGAVGISISNGPDRGKLGFPEREIDRAAYSVCTAIVRDGWDVLYAGNLDPAGFTFKLFRHLAGAYASHRETPFVHLVPEPVFRQARFYQLREVLMEERGVVRTQVSIEGGLVDIRVSGQDILVGSRAGDRDRLRDQGALDEWLARFAVLDAPSAFSAARRHATDATIARVALGGKMGIESIPTDRYEGAMPGIVEEAILTLEARKALIPLGAFGGATRDVAIALDLMDEDRRVPRGPQAAGYGQAIDRVRELASSVPREHRAALRALADDDRTEPLAFQVAALIKDWVAR